LEQRMRDVARERRERALGSAIGRDVRLPAMGRHRLDVDDRTLYLLALHDERGALDQEERRADVHVENFVEALLGGLEYIAAIGEGGGVDEHIDAAEAAIRLGDHLSAFDDLPQVSRDEMGRTSRRRYFFGDP